MENIEVSKFLLQKLEPLMKDNQQVQGSSGKLYLLRDGILFKLYKKYESIILNDDYCFQETSDFSKLNKLFVRQKQVYLTDFPIGYATFNNILVGVILKYYEDSLSLLDYFGRKPEKFLDIMNYIIDSLEELHHNYIYNCDVYTDNFLVDKNDKPHMIDIDNSSYVRVYDNPSQSSAHDDYYCLKSIITDYARLIGFANISFREKIDSFSNSYDGMKDAINLTEQIRKRVMD